MFLEEKKQGEAPITLEPWRQLLLDAVGEINRCGWCQGSYQDEKGRVCVFGAMLNVREKNPTIADSAAWGEAHIALLKKVDRISHWNDQPGRTKAEVISMLRGVALHGRG